MPREFVEGAWRCPNCTTENPGHVKLCRSCGAPQPPDVEFYVPEGPLEFVTAPEEIAVAAGGPDVHCPNCGTRNTNGAKTCSQCGADLDGGQVRRVGDNPATDEYEGVAQPNYDRGFEEEVLAVESAFEDGQLDVVTAEWETADVPLSTHLATDDDSPSNVSGMARVKRTLAIVGLAVLVLGILIALGFVVWNTFFNVTPENVRIDSMSWHLRVPIGEIVTYHETDKNSTESGAYNVTSREVDTGLYEQKTVYEDVQVTRKDESHCGYSLENQGNGYFEKVANTCTFTEKQSKQVDDLSKPIKKTVYSYDVDRWTETRSVDAWGYDTNPEWPDVVLASGETEGDRTQSYVVNYTDAEGKSHSHETSDRNWYVVRSIGEVCSADRNGWGGLNPGITCPAP